MTRVRRLFFLPLLAACAAPKAPALSPPAPREAAAPQAVPLIDRELFFGDPVITGAQLSPDGAYLSFIRPYRGVRNVWVKPVEAAFDDAKPVTADERPVRRYFWSQDSRFVLYAQDKGGDENFHVHAVDPGGKAADKGVPLARDLTPVDGVRAVIYAVPREEPGVVLVGLNDRDPAYHDVYRVAIDSGERILVAQNSDQVGDYAFDEKGALRLAIKARPDGGLDLFRVEGDKKTPIFSTTFEEFAKPLHVHRDGKRIYLETNKGDDVDRSRLVLMNLETGAIELVEEDPDNEVDFGSAWFHPGTDELLATFYVGDHLRVYAKSDSIHKDLQHLQAKLPAGDLTVVSSTLDLSQWLVSVSSDVEPGTVYRYQRSTGNIELLYRSRPDLPAAHLAHMKPIRYSARDGLEIPGYLTVPRNVEPKRLPAVIFPHGGPWSRHQWGYDEHAQFLANRGYAVLQPNFRSSAGYGKMFLNAGNRTWGTGAMQHDITDGVKWLIAKGIADPERICIFGGSYGGYATLAGVTFTPDLYACGIPYVAPSHLVTLIESFPAYWRPFLERTWYRRVGDPRVAKDRADLEARSPLSRVDRIKVPLLVVHGANDPRVKQAESDHIVAALRDKGHAVEYLVAADEGHGFSSPENRLALAVAMERFLGKHLGGRVQESVRPEIAERLAEITVNRGSVKPPCPPTAGGRCLGSP